MNLIIKLLITAAVAYGLTHFLSGVQIADFKTAIIFSLVLGLLNAIVKPILVLLTIPVTVITLGLFLVVINAVIILLSDKLIPGFSVDGFWWALIFSIVLSVISGILSSLLQRD